MSYFDESDIDRVRQAADIAEVIGGYVTLKRRGATEYWGRCPFHTEKTSSFHVRADREMFHCFGCGKGGNVFSFVMEMERITFAEAVRFLAERYHIPLPERVAPVGGPSSSERERLFVANSLAARWFHDRLAKTPRSREAQLAHEYLLGRGITPELISRFQIGFAEPGWDGLVQFAQRSGVSGESLAEGSLASKRRDGSGFVDRFRARVVFPIHSLAGRPVAFGARRVEGITPEEEQAKYINSNETAVYRKGEHLYGLYMARDEIRRAKLAYLVEGYIDLLALVQAGILNGVASLGTALTEAQARLLGRFTGKVVVVYDGDAAGSSASIRAADTWTLAGIEVKMSALPAGEDPDSLLRKQGADTLKQALAQERSFVQFRLEASGAERGMGQSEVLTAAKGLLETIRSVSDPLQRDLLLTELANLTGLRRDALDKVIVGMGRPATAPSPESQRGGLTINSDEVPERDLLKWLVGHPELIPVAMESLAAEQISNLLLRSLYLTFEQSYIQGDRTEMAALPDRINDPDLRAFVAEASLEGAQSSGDDALMAVRDCIRLIMRRELTREKDQLDRDLQSAKQDGGDIRSLRQQSVELNRRINSLQ